MGPDEGYDDCLVFGWRWQVPTSTGSRLWMHAMGMHPRGFITVGPHAVTDVDGVCGHIESAHADLIEAE
jgi:hypothetical protein